ncbi:MAG: ATP-binding protein [Candidatus Tectomicrobia bacterium]
MNAHLDTPRRAVQRLSLRSFFAIPGHGRLLRRTFLIAMLLVSGGLTTSGAIELIFRYQESVMSIRVLQQVMAQDAAFKIQQYVETITHTLRTLSQTADIVTEGITETYRFQLRRLLRVSPAITAVAALDTTGHEKLKVSRVNMVDEKDLLDRSTDDAFVHAKAGASFFGQVYFVRQSEPYMRIAVPIERFVGEVIGVLIAEVNLTYIWKVIASIRVGETGYAYVVSPEGDLIAHPDISLALQKQNLTRLSQVQGALRGAPTRATQQNMQGKDVFTTYTTIPTLGWVVFVERLTDEAYGPLYASLLRLGLLLLLGLGIAGLASWLIGRRVLRPVEALQQGAEQFGDGALHHRIHVHTGDELQVLAETFNRMAGQLQASYADLEGKVEARTQELARSVAALKITSQHKSRFLAHMSHELRTPLNAILGYTELTLKNIYGEIPDKAREKLERVQHSSKHLLTLINAVLDISRIEAGRFELSIAQYSMLSIVETVVIALENQVAEKQLTLTVTAPPDLPIGQGDASRLTQVLFNLVGNAITYTATGEVGINVAVSEGNFTVMVTDTGPGIAPEDQQRIFESFEQAHTSQDRVQSGTGLGLTICKTIIEMHGGCIGVESSLGAGSTFWCTLPVRTDSYKERG